jgi:uncharacterized BrkB/YihY/UPF0761 family membrane protein
MARGASPVPTAWHLRTVAAIYRRAVADHEPDPQPEGPEESRVARTTRRAREEQERLSQRFEAGRQRFETRRSDSLWVDAVFRTYERDNATGGVVLAGALAFRVFLFLIPYVFVLVVGLDLASEASNQDPGTLARKAGIAGVAASAIKTTTDLSVFQRVLAVLVGLLAVFLASRSLLKVLRVVHALAWRVRAGKFKSLGKASGFLMLLVTGALVLAVLVGKMKEQSFLLGLIGVLLSAAIPAALWLVVSWHLPNRASSWKELVPGAVLFGVGVFVLHAITIYWIAREIENKTSTYGAIGAALALLLWAYLLGRVMTASAVLNMALWEQRHEDESPAPGGAH